MGNSSPDIKTVSIRNTHAFSGVSPSGQTLLFPEGSKLRIKNYGRHNRREVNLKSPVRLSIQHRTNTEYSVGNERSFFITDQKYPLDSEITNLIYDPSFQLQTSHQLMSRNSNKKMSEQIQSIIASMEKLGRRLGCSKVVLEQMILELKEGQRIRQSTLNNLDYIKFPSTVGNEEVAITIRRASYNEKIVEQDTKLEERLSTNQRKQKDTLSFESQKEPLLLHHARTTPIKANISYENIEEDESVASSCPQKQPTNQTYQTVRTRGFRSMFSMEVGANLPFLLVQVQNAQVHQSVLMKGCCRRQSPFVIVEARVMKNQNVCALRAAARTKGATNSASHPEWFEQFQLDFPSMQRAQFSISLYTGEHNYILNSLNDLEVYYKTIEFKSKQNIFDHEVLASVRVRLQLVPNREIALLRHFENCKSKITDTLKAKKIISRFKQDPANNSFIGAISEGSYRSQVVKIYARKSLRKNDTQNTQNSESFIDSRKQLAKLQSPSVFSDGSFESPNYFSRKTSIKQEEKLRKSNISGKFGDESNTESDDIYIPPNN